MLEVILCYKDLCIQSMIFLKYLNAQCTVFNYFYRMHDTCYFSMYLYITSAYSFFFLREKIQ